MKSRRRPSVLVNGEDRKRRAVLLSSIFALKWFTRRGRRVLYGDTDSFFVETGLPDTAGYAEFCAFCETLAGEIRREYRLEFCMELRFEKAYRRFMIPPLRGGLRRVRRSPGFPVSFFAWHYPSRIYTTILFNYCEYLVVTSC